MNHFKKLSTDAYDKLDETLAELVDYTTDDNEFNDPNHPIMKVMRLIRKELFKHDIKHGYPHTKYYCKASERYIEDPRDSYIPCPVCGSPPDYCQDHNHYYCEVCSEPLECQVEDVNGNYIWACEHCEHCQYCGSPNIFTSHLHEKQYHRCEDCGKFEPDFYKQETLE